MIFENLWERGRLSMFWHHVERQSRDKYRATPPTRLHALSDPVETVLARRFLVGPGRLLGVSCLVCQNK